MGIFCSQMDVFCHQMDPSHHSFKYMCTQSCIIFLCRLQPDGCVLPPDSCRLPLDGYSLCPNRCSHHRFNFTFFTFQTAVNNIHLVLYGDLHVQQALAMVAAEEAYSEVLQLEFEPREGEDEQPPVLQGAATSPSSSYS